MLNEMSVMCFLSVAKHLSFTKSAEELFMSRQAVSKTILSLEKRLGVKLFDRTTNIVELTVEGKLYHSYFRNLVQDFETFTETIGKTGTQTVRMLIGYELGVVIGKKVIDVLGDFRRRKANTDLKIVRFEPQVIENKLLGGHLDMAFTTIPMHSEIYKDFPHIILEHAGYVLVTSKNHPKVNENTVLSDFNGEQAIYWNIDNSPDIICRKNFFAAWYDIGITVIPSVQCKFLSSAYAELLMGNAVMLCNSMYEICTFPEIITYPLPKRENFCCVWSHNASAEIKELAEAFSVIDFKE